MRKFVFILSTSLTFLVFGFLIFVWFTTEHFAEQEPTKVICNRPAPHHDLRRPLRVLTWNIQFLAGKNYIFFYDAMDGSGKDEAPTQEDTELNLKEVVRVINEINPDILLIQEVDVDAKRTYYQDQVQLLFDALADAYPCVTSTYYWRAGFIPHPNILGSVGLKLATFSRFEMQSAMRYSLGVFPSNIISRQFRPKRALLESVILTSQGPPIHLFNTHLEAYAQGSSLMEQQVQILIHNLDRLEKKQVPWVLGGDLNLLMPGKSYHNLSPLQRSLYQEKSEIEKLVERFSVIPLPSDINGKHSELWFTHFPNDPEVKAPDRTLDYLFYSKQFKLLNHTVRRHDTLKISDHLPLIGEFQFNSN